MSSDRRKFLKSSVKILGAFGVGMASLPFIRSMLPTVKSQPSWMVVDFPKLMPGQLISYATPWNKVIYVLHRTGSMIDGIKQAEQFLDDPSSEKSEQPLEFTNELRSFSPEYLIVEALCTHLGCSVAFQSPAEVQFDKHCSKYGCFMCPCHGSRYDLAGRVWKHQPAPMNLVVPAHEFIGETSVKLFDPART